MAGERLYGRFEAAMAGGLLLLAGLATSPYVALILLLATQVPDAYEPDGDPCCSTPDTWGETLDGLGAVLLVVLVVGAGWSIAIALLRWGVWNRRTKPKTVLLRVPLIVTLAVASTIGVTLFAQRGQARLKADCGGFRFSASAWNALELERRETLAQGLAECSDLGGRTTAQIRALLGPPDTVRHYPANQYNSASTSWTYRGPLYLSFERGRVTDARYEPGR